MKKQLGLLTSLIVLCATALCWSGCNRYQGSNDDFGYGQASYPSSDIVSDGGSYESSGPTEYGPVRTADVNLDLQTQGPVYNQSFGPAYNQSSGPVYNQGPDNRRADGTRSITTDGVTVTASQPKLCILGDNYVLDLCVQAHIDVCHVEVNAILPEGVSLVRSEPEGTIQGKNGQLTWMFDSMKCGETRHSRVTLRADREGNLCVCFCVTAVPVQFCTILCAKPILECTKCGPEEACPGDSVHYTVTVTNRGTCAAEDVVLTDIVPDGLEHSSGLRTLTYKLGTLEPCQTKKINICFTAVKRGKICNRITATACNATPTSCEAVCIVCKECVELVKVGPKEVPIGKNAEYQITVTNPGDKSLTEVVLTDQAPAATSIVEAKGAIVNCNQAIWRFKELKPGEKQTVSLVLTTCTPGYFVNKVCVDNCQQCRACAEAGTRWKGRPSLSVCFEESDGPVCVGEGVTYTLRVSNQGSEEDSNVNVVVRFPSEIAPVSASGETQATISGNTVTFAPVKVFGPRQVAEFRVEGQAKASGDARIKAEISSDSIRTPIVQEESTIVN